jgi:hypothetical protein
MLSFTEVVKSFSNFSQDELVQLSRQINREFKLKRAVEAKKLKDSLRVGDSVTFTGRERAGRGVKGATFLVEGHVTKVKRKRVLVKCLNGQTWDVNILSLTKVEA